MRGPLWPQLRAAFVAFHAVVVVAMSTPVPGQLDDPEAWDKPRVQRNFARLTDLLRGAGLSLGDRAVQSFTWDMAQGYLHARAPVAAVLSPYMRLAGIDQGWRMFLTGRRTSPRLYVEIRELGQREYRPVYVRGSTEHRWLARELDYHRLRKLCGWAVKGHEVEWHHFSLWLARRAAQDFPRASHLRVRSFLYEEPTPEQVRAGVAPRGHFDRVRIHPLEPLR